MTLAEALKIRAVVPVSELRIARHFARVWKMAAKKARFDVMLLKSINKGNREVYEVRIAELEDTLRKVRPLLQDIMDIHRDPSDGQYNECDTDPCAWCVEAKELLQQKGEG